MKYEAWRGDIWICVVLNAWSGYVIVGDVWYGMPPHPRRRLVNSTNSNHRRHRAVSLYFCYDSLSIREKQG